MKFILFLSLQVLFPLCCVDMCLYFSNMNIRLGPPKDACHFGILPPLTTEFFPGLFLVCVRCPNLFACSSHCFHSPLGHMHSNHLVLVNLFAPLKTHISRICIGVRSLGNPHIVNFPTCCYPTQSTSASTTTHHPRPMPSFCSSSQATSVGCLPTSCCSLLQVPVHLPFPRRQPLILL